MATVRKRVRKSEATRKTRTTWLVDFYDQNGERHVESFPTWREANDARSKRHEEIRKGTYRPRAEIPMFRELAATWLSNKTGQSLRPASLAQWESHLTKHLGPAFGDVRLDRISVSDVEAFRDKKKLDGLSAQTVNKLLTTMTSIFRLAERRGLSERNPAALAERLRVTGGEISVGDAAATAPALEIRTDDILAPREVAKLIEKAAPGFYQTFIMTAALTGARINELLALTWRDVDLDGGNLSIRRGLSWAKTKADGKDPKPRFFEPKTKSSRRTIPLAPELASALKRWKLACPISELDLVFPTPQGGPKYYSTVYHEGFGPSLKAAELRDVTFHSLRHSFASMLIQRGAAPTEVAHLLGHSSPAVTLKVYSHWFRSAKTTSVQDLARELLANRPGSP